MPAKSNRAKEIKKDIKKVKKELKQANKALEELDTRLEEIEIYSSSSEEELQQEGDRVVAITDPHKDRTGTVVVAGDYCIQVKADWSVIQQNGKREQSIQKGSPQP